MPIRQTSATQSGFKFSAGLKLALTFKFGILGFLNTFSVGRVDLGKILSERRVGKDATKVGLVVSKKPESRDDHEEDTDNGKSLAPEAKDRHGSWFATVLGWFNALFKERNSRMEIHDNAGNINVSLNEDV